LAYLIQQRKEKKMKKMTAVFLALFFWGCSHALEVTNLDKYQTTNYALNQGQRPTVGLVASEGDIHCSKLIKETASQLQKQADVTYPCHPGIGKDPEYLVEIKTNSNYKGSFWNWFPISFPGFLIFTPAWHGYVYKANYDFDVDITKEGTRIDTFKVPVEFNIRHADMDRTWVELGWLEWGVTALVGGLFSIPYDPDVTPQLVDKVERPLGEYMADKIMKSVKTNKPKGL
jgi:hypothetical protein